MAAQIGTSPTSREIPLTSHRGLRAARSHLRAAPSFLEEADEIENKARLRLAERLRGLALHSPATKLEDCGQRRIMTKDGEQAMPRWCRQKLCPVCRPLLACQVFDRYFPRLQEVMGEQGATCLVTHTLPPGRKSLLDRGLQIHCELRRFRTWSGWKRGSNYRMEAGVITAFELGGGISDPGHPHGHQIVAAPSPEMALEVAEWLQDRWLQLHSSASWKAQKIDGPHAGILGAEGKLRYLAKGLIVNPGWPDDLVVDAVRLSTQGLHTITASGMGMRVSARTHRPTAIF